MLLFCFSNKRDIALPISCVLEMEVVWCLDDVILCEDFRFGVV